MPAVVACRIVLAVVSCTSADPSAVTPTPEQAIAIVRASLGPRRVPAPPVPDGPRVFVVPAPEPAFSHIPLGSRLDGTSYDEPPLTYGVAYPYGYGFDGPFGYTAGYASTGWQGGRVSPRRGTGDRPREAPRAVEARPTPPRPAQLPAEQPASRPASGGVVVRRLF